MSSRSRSRCRCCSSAWSSACSISIFQAVTQIQEQTLSFIPKILATAAVLVVGGPWMLDQLLSYTRGSVDVDPEPHRLTQLTLQQLIAQFGEQQVVAFFLVLARVSPLFVLAPLFSQQRPGRVRGIVAVALAIGLSPVVGSGADLPDRRVGPRRR